MSTETTRRSRNLSGAQLQRLCSGRSHVQIVGAALGRSGARLDTSTVPARPVTPQLSRSLAAAAQQPTVAAIREGTLAALAAAPLVVEPAAVQQPLTALARSATPAEARVAASALTAAVQRSHLQVQRTALAEAAGQAAAEVGFPQITVERAGEQVRVIAADAFGRAIITEIRTTTDMSTEMHAEVVGVGEPACETTLAAFEAALARRGIETEVVSRRPTRGVPTSEAARAFIGRQLRQERERRRAAAARASRAAPASPTATQPRQRTRQRLNG